jgi:hypothetical protein
MRRVALTLLVVVACGSPPGRADVGAPTTASAPATPPAPSASAADAALPVPPPSGPHAPYVAAAVTQKGVVLGLVTLARPPARAQVAPIAGPSACPGSQARPPLELAPTGGVIGAVVWLDDIARGKPFAAGSDEPPVAELAFSGCVLTPRTVIVAGPGARLAVRSDDPVRHVATLRYRGAAWLDTGNEAERVVAAWPMPLAGQRFEKAIAAPGLVDVRGEAAEGPAPHGLAVVARHPYFAVTDADGRYRLADVPPGTYQVRAWYPGGDGVPELWALGKAEVADAGAAEVNLVLVAP